MKGMTGRTMKIWLLSAMFVLSASWVPAAQKGMDELSSMPAPTTPPAMESGLGQGDPLPLQGFEDLTVGNYFSCRIPLGWGKDDYPFGLSPTEKKIYGLMLYGPGYGPVPVRISVYYYAAENLLYKSIGQFVELHSQPLFGPMEGDNYGPVTEATVADRKAMIFERQKSEFVPMLPGINEPAEDDGKVYERMARPVPVIERFVVVPAESGFYALRYYAPAENFQDFLSIFEEVTASFRPLQ